MAILFQDISTRKRAERDLRDMNQTLERLVEERTATLRRYHDIIEATGAPICAFDRDCRLIAFNRAHNDEFCRVHGFVTRIGGAFASSPPDQQEIVREHMERALSGQRFTVVEALGRPEYGVPRWEITYTPLLAEDGSVLGAFHQASDISDRLAAEAELDIAQEALRPEPEDGGDGAADRRNRP
ncbi:PAS domain-containing protein [Sphingomonas sp. MMS24-JH45]